ncbi:Protein C30G7.5, partial [Aphelenchoides avenae]
AMCYPMYYRNKNHARYVAAVVVAGVGLGVLDVIIEFSLSTPVPEVLGCAAAGCFMSFKFHVYWGCSNMILNVVMLVLTVVVACQLRKTTMGVTMFHKKGETAEERAAN